MFPSPVRAHDGDANLGRASARARVCTRLPGILSSKRKLRPGHGSARPGANRIRHAEIIVRGCSNILLPKVFPLAS